MKTAQPAVVLCLQPARQVTVLRLEGRCRPFIIVCLNTSSAPSHKGLCTEGSFIFLLLVLKTHCGLTGLCKNIHLTSKQGSAHLSTVRFGGGVLTYKIGE